MRSIGAWLLPVALIACSTSSWAQGVDYWTRRSAERQVGDAAAVKTKVLQDVTHLYFALGCGVVPNSAYASALRGQMVEAAYHAMTAARDFDQTFQDRVAEAAAFGLNESKIAGCGYWRDNEDEALAIRSAATSALQ